MTTIPDIRTSIENKNSLVIDKHAQQGTFLRVFRIVQIMGRSGRSVAGMRM